VSRERRARVGRGLTLVEGAVSIVLVGVLLVAALQTVGMARKGQRLMSDRARAQQLALDLMNEILTRAYETPPAPGLAKMLGLEAGKSNANRSQFTDVDDYNGWTESPPRDRSGNALAGTTGWTRSVTVQWADTATWAPTTQPDTGLKLVTVTASRGGSVSTITAYRSVAWVDTVPSSTDAANHAPTGVSVASKTSASKRLDTTLDASTSSDADNDALSFVWNFGDGTTGAGTSVSHSYTTVGTFTCTLTAYDGRGGVGTASVVLTVTP
jgi:hypothetical protein